MDKKTIIIIVLVMLILAGICYILVPKYNLIQQQEGFQIGYEQAIVEVIERVSTCQQVPISYDNYTLNLFAAECVQQNQK